MIGKSMHHGTIILERAYDAPIERVFAALADPVSRGRWSAPSETAVLIYDESEFRVGGRDVFRCGAKGDPKYRGETRYHDIAPPRRIVSTEVIDELDKRLSVGVTTVELEPDGERTKLKFTVQLASLDGPEMIEGTRAGYTSALENLVRELQRDGRGS